MRFGYCVNMLSTPGSDASGREWIPMVGEIGFDYVELPLAQMMAYADDKIERLFAQPMREAGLTCNCTNNFFPASIRLTGPDANREAALRYARRAMGWAKRLGARKIVFGSAGARNYPLGFSKDEAFRQMMSLLSDLEPLCAQYGITLVMEHLNRSESNILNSLAEGVHWVESANLPHIRCLFDNYHMFLSGGGLDEIALAGNRLMHVHLARVLGRSLPVQGDEGNWPVLMQALRSVGYDGDCSIEAYAPETQRREKITESLRFLRSVAVDST